MGNSASSSGSSEDDDQSFAGRVRIVATQFILTQDYKSMRDMASNPSYCNQILQLAQKLIKQNMTAEQLKAFAQQLRGAGGAAASEAARANGAAPPQQQADCAVIAEYFTLVAHLFSAIMTTVNPIFYYKNNKGQRKSQTLQTKQYLPEYDRYGQLQEQSSSAATYVVEGSFCTRRIDALTSDDFSKTHVKNDDTDKSIDDMVLTPQLVCNQIEEEQRKDRFNSEIGLAELDKLYDYDDPAATTSGFRGQDQWLQQEQQQLKKDIKLADLGRFYQAVMGETDSIVLPSGVRKFADIDLTASLRVRTWKKDVCDNTISKSTIITANNANAETRNLFEQYGDHVRNMMTFNESQKELLLKQLNDLFTIKEGDNNAPAQQQSPAQQQQQQQQAQQQQQQEQEPRKVVIMNEGVTLADVKAMIITTRNIILNLYITCESSFLDGLELYEAIIEQRVLNKTTEDDSGLDALIHSILTNGVPPTKALAQQALAQQPQPRQQQQTQPRQQAQVPSAQPQVPSAQPQVPSAQPQVPSAQPQVPSAQPQVPSAQAQVPPAQAQVPQQQPQTVLPAGSTPTESILKDPAKPQCKIILTQPQCDDPAYTKQLKIKDNCQWNSTTSTCDKKQKSVLFADEVGQSLTTKYEKL